MPFIAALIWASIIVISTYNFMLKLQKILWNKKGLAVTVMVLLILAVILVPIAFVVGTIIINASEISSWFNSLSELRFQSAPDWLVGLPLIGSQIANGWDQITSLHNDEIIKKIIPFLDDIVKWFVAQAGGFGLFMIHFLITVIICGILYSKGEVAVKGIRNFATRLAGERGDAIVILAGQAVKAVTMGVVITALIQSILGGIALAVCGVPRAGLLTAIMFILGLTQIGGLPVLLPSVIWKYTSGDPVWGTVLLILAIIVGASDNFIRPFLIKRGADLPILLIFAGVIGGLIAFGIVGLFIGPVILAVTYTLLKAWINEHKSETLKA
jgi:predicted PurR-regulated permease PerM